MPDSTIGVETVDPNPLSDSSSTVNTTRPLKTYDLSQPIITLPNGLAIRENRHSDAENLSKHANNKKIARQMRNRFPDPYTVDKAHEWITMCRNENNWVAIGPTDPKSNNTAGTGQKLPHAWSIALNGEAIGGCGYELTTDVHARVLEFGYWIGEEHWGKGVMSVVLPAFVEWIWETYPWLVKLEPKVYSWNKGSARLLEKCGFVLEGRTRCSVEKYGVLGDILIYGMVREGVAYTGEAPEV